MVTASAATATKTTTSGAKASSKSNRWMMMMMITSKKKLFYGLFGGLIILVFLNNYLLLEPTTKEATTSTEATSSASSLWIWISIFLSVFVVYKIIGKKRRTAAATAKRRKRQTTKVPIPDITNIKRVSKLPYKDRMNLAYNGPTLIFDGVCHLCNGSMKWFSERCVPEVNVWYMWCQHVDSQTLLKEYGITNDDLLRSWAYIEDGVVYRGSTAWLRAVRNLKRPWCYLSLLENIPLCIRETVYGFIAQNRYKIFGKSDNDACERPSKFMMSRMLHSLQIEKTIIR